MMEPLSTVPPEDLMTHELIAIVCYEANRAYCNVATGDLSRPPWDKAPEAVKKSTIAGVLMHLTDRNNMTARDFHEAWYEFKTAEGWTYGPVIDQEKKEHPCMLPFDELPMEQKVKDYLFKAVADAFVQAFADAMAKEGLIGVAK